MKRPALVVCLSLFLASCAAGLIKPGNLIRTHAYEGPTRPVNELVTVYGHYDVSGESVYIQSVDAKGLFKASGLISSYPSVAYLTPGRHKVTLLYRFANYVSQTDTIEIDAEAGSTLAVFGTRADADHTAFSIKKMPAGYVPTDSDLMPRYRPKATSN